VRNQRAIVGMLARIRSEFGVTIMVVAHDLNPLLGILDGAIYLLDGHAHFNTMDEVVDEELLTHLYGTSIQVVHTPQGDLYMRSV
jgi:zinc/manganese transport system ATP-binding protein